MSTEKTNSSTGKGWKILALSGFCVLAIAFIFGLWGLFGNSRLKADSTNSLNRPTEITEKSPMPNSSKVDDKTSKDSQNTKSVVPAALIDAGEFGENIYDAAKIDDWKAAEAKLKDLKASVERLNGENIGSVKLDESFAKLEKLISANDKKATLLESNKFTFDAAELSAKYYPAIPVEVTKLDFYGREIEIWAEEKDEMKLKATTAKLRKTWDAIKPKVAAHNGTKEAAVFEDLVKKSESAKSISDYSKLATPILDEVDNLENVFG